MKVFVMLGPTSLRLKIPRHNKPLHPTLLNQLSVSYAPQECYSWPFPLNAKNSSRQSYLLRPWPTGIQSAMLLGARTEKSR